MQAPQGGGMPSATTCKYLILLNRCKYKVETQIRFNCLLSFAALVQPSVATGQDVVKESPFGAMIPPNSTLPGGFMASAIPGAGMFNPVGVQSQQATGDKTAQSAESVDAAELTLQGEQCSVFLT